MLKTITEYDKEILIGRVVKAEAVDGRIKLSIVENYDDKKEDAETKWANATAFGKSAEGLGTLNDKGYLIGAVIVAALNIKENGEYVNKTINWFKIARFPAKK